MVVQGLLNPPPKHLEIKVAGEKGRGLLATGDIRNSFICKYKVPKSRPPFTRNQQPAVEQEYKVVRDVTSSRHKMWKGDGGVGCPDKVTPVLTLIPIKHVIYMRSHPAAHLVSIIVINNHHHF